MNNFENREIFSKNLIGEVKKYEVIYNMAHPDRIDHSKRRQAWVDISKNLNVSVQYCKGRWSDLRIRYKLEHSKMADPDYQTKWKYIDQIGFLKDFIDPNANQNFLQSLAIMTKRDLFCRTCLCPIDNDDEQNTKSYNIFNTKDVVDKLIQCTNQPIEASDKYPRKLCEQCYKKLLDVNKFQCMCLDSLEKFNIMWEKQQSEMKHEEDEIPENPVESLAENNDIVELEPLQMEQNVNEKTAAINLNNNNNNAGDISNADPLTENEDSQHLIEMYFSEVNEEEIMVVNKVDETYDEEIAVDEFEESYDEDTTIIEFKVEKETDLKQLEESNNSETAENEFEETYKVETGYNDTSDMFEMMHEELQSSQDEEECQDDDNKDDNEISKDILDNKNTVSDDLQTKKSRNKYPLKCDICSQSFNYQHRFEAHKRRHQELPGYLCTYENCDRAYNRLDQLRRHINEHNGIRNVFKCNIDNCSQVFTSISGLGIHKRNRHNIGKPVNKSFECEICHAVLRSLGSLKGHRYIHMDKSQWPFACDVDGCKIRFRFKGAMMLHLSRHAGIKKYVCPHCGVRKTSTTELGIHINRHTFEKKYPCSYCPRVMKSSGDRSKHIHQVHEGIKQNLKIKKSKDGVYERINCSCRYCGLELANPSNLKWHELTHTGEKPYPCKICGKKFASPVGRSNHEHVHSDEKRFKCDECGKAFKRVNSLKTHKLLHVEGAIPYTCDQCGQGFRWPGTMYAHKKKHHIKQNEDKLLVKEGVNECETIDISFADDVIEL